MERYRSGHNEPYSKSARYGFPFYGFRLRFPWFHAALRRFCRVGVFFQSNRCSNSSTSDCLFNCISWRVVRVVEGAALEMLCPERDLGFESLTLRQKKHTSRLWCVLCFLQLYCERNSCPLFHDRIFIGDMCSGKRLSDADSDKPHAVCLPYFSRKWQCSTAYDILVQ